MWRDKNQVQESKQVVSWPILVRKTFFQYCLVSSASVEEGLGPLKGTLSERVGEGTTTGLGASGSGQLEDGRVLRLDNELSKVPEHSSLSVLELHILLSANVGPVGESVDTGPVVATVLGIKGKGEGLVSGEYRQEVF
jgi:hypothetical protein